MLKKCALFIFLLFPTSKIYANPSPLGIELNKSTLDDVKKSYRILISTPMFLEGYYNNLLDEKTIRVEGLSTASVISNKNNIIESVVLLLDKNKFTEVNQTLSEKYKVVFSNLLSDGDREVKLQDGDCEIIIQISQRDLTMTVIYATKNLANQYYNRTEKTPIIPTEFFESMRQVLSPTNHLD